ncbi:unnamed protein product [Macrosiphum euphorbiae]|uniref:RNA-directed DNA polymerase n=1 Tax=Macrosiphum euphorbiae TaxID=13131 RepID=A0AAV0VVG7_9HEMI|nr:unnamed protein product [Macrosiphum euphorbiae]
MDGNASNQVSPRVCTGQQMGQLTEFKLKEDDFNSWIERFELYVMLNEINLHKKQLLFLTLLGNDGYALLRDLCTPSKPIEKKYDDLKKLLTDYINPKPNLITERYKFKERRQAANETIIQFITGLKKMSEHCEFGTVLDDALRDQVIWGIRDSNIKKRLLSEDSLTFKKCIELSLAMESANNDISKMEHHEAVNYHTASKKKNTKFLTKVKQSSSNNSGKTGGESNMKGTKRNWVCYCCGKSGHTKPSCKYISYKCSICNKVGHLKNVCKNKEKNVNNVDLDNVDLNLNSLFNLETRNVSFVQPFCLKLLVDNVTIEFQVDTGSAVSVMSVKDFDKFKLGCVEDLERTDVNLKAYNGSIIIPIGILKVKVKYKNQWKSLSLYIVMDGGPPIIGRDWLIELEILPLKLNFHSLSQQDIIQKYPSVFNEELGCFKHKTFKLYLKENTIPVFCKPRVIPFSLKDSVSKELERLIKAELLVPVESSDWATPIVPVVKPDKSIRLCGDYKVTLNKYLEVDRYPIPRVVDLISAFQGAIVFCTLDLCQAYQQLLLDEESQKLTTISTHKGLYMFKRLPYGISSAPGMLQREMEKLLCNIPGTVCFYDDVVVSGKDYTEVNNRLDSVLKKLNDAGLTLKKGKCKFFSDNVTFLGYHIDKEGLHIPKERIKAITEAPIPKNVQEVKAFLGLVNYYGKFIKNMSFKAGALYALLKNNVKFHWGVEQKLAFKKIKESIVSENILVHYNSSWELIVASDASPIGIGAVLSHRLPDGSEKPIAFASRTLTDCEKKYAQIDKEALAIVFAVRYFHQYVFGRQFILRTDHKPLVSIFGENKGIPVMAAHRLQRYAVFLSGYSYKIEFINGVNNGNADALSRLPIKDSDNINDAESDNFFINLIMTNIKSITDLDICTEIKEDKVLREVYFRVLSNKWPDKIKKVKDELKPYFNRKNELTIEVWCLLWGHRIVVPGKFQKELLNELHHTHMGTVKMKSVARSYIWWPGIDYDIQNITKSCVACLANSNNPPKSVLHSWPWPEGPSQRIHLDFLGPVDGKMFIVIIDAFSKWLYVKHLLNITTVSTIKVLREYFSIWGIPKKLVTDNGPSLCSYEMEEFLKINGVTHIKTPPYSPSTNGAAENAVKTFKMFLKKCAKNSDIEDNISKFILAYNSSNHCSTGVSPAELHIGRQLNIALDRLIVKAKYNYTKSLERAKENYKGGRTKSYEIGDEVMCRNYGEGNKWIQGKIIQQLSPVTYLIKIIKGNIYKRHLNQIIDCMNKNGTEVEINGDLLEELQNADNNKGNIKEQIVISESVKEAEKEVELETEDKVEGVELRKSRRVIKPPVRLDL